MDYLKYHLIGLFMLAIYKIIFKGYLKNIF